MVLLSEEGSASASMDDTLRYLSLNLSLNSPQVPYAPCTWVRKSIQDAKLLVRPALRKWNQSSAIAAPVLGVTKRSDVTSNMARRL